LSVAGHETRTFEAIRSNVEIRPNEVVSIEVERGGRIQQIRARLRADSVTDPSGRKIQVGQLGVYPATVPLTRAISMGVGQTVRVTIWIVEGAGKLVIGQGSRQDVGGPIKIAQFAGQVASLGALPFVQLLALFSINLGFINLLPVPLLDGGHLFFYTVEAVRRRPLSAKALDWAFRGGLAVILALVVFTTINDLGSVGLWDRLQRLIG